MTTDLGEGKLRIQICLTPLKKIDLMSHSTTMKGLAWLGLAWLGLVWFGFFVKWHVNLNGLFNVIQINSFFITVQLT